MFPLPVFLIGFNPGRLRDDVMTLLLNQGATVEGEYTDVTTALKDVVDPSACDALVVLQATNEWEVNELRRLRRALPGLPILALAGYDTLMAAMRAGANQVVTLPPSPEDFEEALNALAGQFSPGSNPAHRLIAVVGVKGGCGTTTVATNLGAELADRFKRAVILTEPTHRVGKLADTMSIQPEFTTQDMFRIGHAIDEVTLRRTLKEVWPGLAVLAGEYRSIPEHPPQADQVMALVAVLRLMADELIIDLPCTYDDAFFQLLAASDEIILVGEQKIPAIRVITMLTEHIRRMEGQRGVFVVLNRYDPDLAGFQAGKLARLIEADGLLTIANDYKAVNTALEAGKLLRVAAPKSPALRGIARLADLLQTYRNPDPRKHKARRGTPLVDDSDAGSATALLGRLGRVLGLGR